MLHRSLVRCHRDTRRANPPVAGPCPLASAPDLSKPSPAAALGSELWLKNQKTVAIITYCPHARLPCPRPRQPPFCSRIPLLRSFPPPHPLGEHPLMCSETSFKLYSASQAKFPPAVAQARSEYALGSGAGKAQVCDRGNCSQRPISCAKRPRRNSSQPLPPSRQHLLIISAPNPGPTSARSSRRTQGRTHPTPLPRQL